MAFTALSPSDKNAFFSLLDEYFASRPGILDGEPQARHPIARSTTPLKAQATSNLATIGHRDHQSEAISTSTPQPPLPPQVPEGRSNQPGNLLAQKKLGDVDFSSGKNMFTSLRHSTVNKTATPPPVAPAIPSAFGQKKNTFGPPPVRRVSAASTAKIESEPDTLPETESVDAKRGEWVEALYDYDGEDAGDLPLHDGQRVLVVEKTSADWWTGESEGRRGLFPASYVKVV